MEPRTERRAALGEVQVVGAARYANATRNEKKPMIPRSAPMLEAANTMPPRRNSRRSRSLAGSAATAVRGSRKDANTAAMNVNAASSTDNLRAREQLRNACGDRARETRDHGQQREPRVLLDELTVGADGGGDDRGLGNGVALLEHEDRERQREQEQAVEVRDHQERDNRPHGVDGDDHHAATAAGAVEGGSDQGADQHERRHCQREIQADPPSGRAGVDVEEERAGKRNGDHGVAGGRQRVHATEPHERRHDERAALGPDRRRTRGSSRTIGFGQRAPAIGHGPILVVGD